MRVRVVRGWVWPGLIVLALAALLITFAAGAPWLTKATGLYRLVLYAAGFALAWRYRRSRVAAILLGLFILDALLRPSSAALQPDVGSVWDASGVLLLFLVPVVVTMKDRSVRSSRGLTQISIVVVGLLSGLLLWAVRPEFLAWTWQPFLPWDLSVLGMADAVLVLGLFGLLVTGGLALARGHRLDKGFFWIALAVPLALRGGPESLESMVFLSAAGLMLIANVMEKSYALSGRDDVTGLPTRRALRQEIKRAGSYYALAFVVVDNYYALYLKKIKNYLID